MTVSTTGLRRVRFSSSFAPSFVRPSVRTTPVMWRTKTNPEQEKFIRSVKVGAA